MENGDVLKTQRKPFIYHYGVYFLDNGIEKIIHSTDSKDVVIETLNYFLEERKLIQVYKTNISGCTTDFIFERYNKLKDKKYSLLAYDCEDFVSEFTFTKMVLKQKTKYIISTGLILFLTYKIFNKKKGK